MKSVSVIVPVYNEEANVSELHREIVDVCSGNNYEFEIIFVNDGSSDNTLQKLKSLKPVRIINFRKNFGQTAAMDAGIKCAKHEYLVTLDGDGQNDPSNIPEMIDYLEKNDLDIVTGWRKNRKDPFLKRFISRGANVFRKILVNDGIHDSGCSLKVFRRDCLKGLTLYGEMHRFIPALLKIRGFSVGEIVVNHRPRTKGKTKYNWKRTMKGLIDMISVWFWNKFSVRPLHLLGGFGFFFLFLASISGSMTLINFFQGQNLSGTLWPLLTVFFFLAGVQFFIFGLIADVLMRNYFETTNNDPYYIKEIIEN